MSSGVRADLSSLGGVGYFEIAARAKALGGDLLASVGAPVLPSPPHVQDAVVEAMSAPRSLDPRGFIELRTAIAESVGTAEGVTVDPAKNLLMTHGAMHALAVIMRTIASAGDEVVVPAPTFFFDGLIRLAGARPVWVPSASRTGWSWDREAIEASITDRTVAILICNPTNPTGYLPSAADLQWLVDLAHERSVTIISDESYQRFIHDDGKQTSLASFGVDDPLLVTATSLSKNYAFTQWRVGYVLGPPRLVSAATTVFNWDALYVGHVQQAAALAAITGPQDWVSGALDQYPSKRDRLVDAVNAIDGLAVVRPQAGSWAYIDATALGLADEQLEDRLIRLGVAAASSRFFQGPPGHLRVVYGSSVDVLDRTVAALRQLASGADAPVAE